MTRSAITAKTPSARPALREHANLCAEPRRVFKALAAFRGALVREGTLDPVLRELVRIKIAGLNACRY
jgi:alkylhydroperoxidase family enzyme